MVKLVMNSPENANKSPTIADTIYLPEAIDYDFYIRKFEATTFDFSENLKAFIETKIKLTKEDNFKGLIAEISHINHFKSSAGRLRFETELFFYLPYTNNPNPNYLSNFSFQGFTINHTQLAHIVKGFKNHEGLIIKLSDMRLVKLKWEQIVRDFISPVMT